MTTATEQRIAGRELNAEVAEKLMGWRDSVTSNYPWQFVDKRTGGIHRGLPRFSTDIGTAWLVLDHVHTWLFSRRAEFYVILRNLCVTEEGWKIAWPEALGVFRDRMPEFICRAALAIQYMHDEIASASPTGNDQGQ
jgi:hypothetical protein